MITLPCIIFQLLPFVIFSHQYSQRIKICNHFIHQFSLPKDLLKWNCSALLLTHSSNEQTHSAGDGHVDMALVIIIINVIPNTNYTNMVIYCTVKSVKAIQRRDQTCLLSTSGLYLEVTLFFSINEGLSLSGLYLQGDLYSQVSFIQVCSTDILL
jgi:hypothetical protein